MKFDDLDIKMRVYETSVDYCVLPGVYIESVYKVTAWSGRGGCK